MRWPRSLIGWPLVCAATLAWGVDQKTLWGHIHALFPNGEKLASASTDPPVARVESQAGAEGHVLLTDRLAPIPAYSRHPISLLVAVDLDGVIEGVRIVEHREPILGAGVDPAMLNDFVAQYRGLPVGTNVRVGGDSGDRHVAIDGISGATITAMVMNASVMRSLEKAAEVLTPKSRTRNP